MSPYRKVETRTYGDQRFRALSPASWLRREQYGDPISVDEEIPF